MEDDFKSTALIIDDESDICFLLSGILKKLNFSSKMVNSISAAKALLTSYKPQIIFLDNHLPDGLGVDFIKTIRLTNPMAKIIMITAHDSLADRNLAYNKGVADFIGKPFSKNSIYQSVTEVLKSD